MKWRENACLIIKKLWDVLWSLIATFVIAYFLCILIVGSIYLYTCDKGFDECMKKCLDKGYSETECSFSVCD